MKQLLIEALVGLSLVGLVGLCVTGTVAEPARTILGVLAIALGPLAAVAPWVYYAE